MKAEILTLPGDGIGPEIVSSAVRVLDRVAERFGHTFVCREGLIGGAAIDAAGTPLPEDTVRALTPRTPSSWAQSAATSGMPSPSVPNPPCSA